MNYASLTIHTTDGITATLSPATDPRVKRCAATVAYVACEADRLALVGELRALGVRAASTYVRVM